VEIGLKILGYNVKRIAGFLSRRKPIAIPQAIDNPCPKEPVATSIPGQIGTGCPCSLEPNNLKVNNSSLGKYPNCAKTEYM
jgi:hypothetical protein